MIAAETPENKQESSIVASIFIISQLCTLQNTNYEFYVKSKLLN